MGGGGWTDFCDVKCVRNDSSDTFLKWEDRLFIQEYCIGERVWPQLWNTRDRWGIVAKGGLLRALQRSETHHIHILLATKGSLLDWLTCSEAVYFHNGCKQAGGRIGEISCHLSRGASGQERPMMQPQSEVKALKELQGVIGCWDLLRDRRSWSCMSQVTGTAKVYACWERAVGLPPSAFRCIWPSWLVLLRLKASLPQFTDHF